MSAFELELTTFLSVFGSLMVDGWVMGGAAAEQYGQWTRADRDLHFGKSFRAVNNNNNEQEDQCQTRGATR